MIKVISSLVAFFSISALCAQAPSGEIPKLVVGITIDQLRGDYLEMFRHTFGSKGFNRLLNSGLVYSNVHYDFPNLDKASTITTIYTGANPSYHGITAEKKYLLDSNQEVSSHFDNNFLGNFTTETLPGVPEYIDGVSYYIVDLEDTADLINESYNPYQVTIDADDLSITGD